MTTGRPGDTPSPTAPLGQYRPLADSPPTHTRSVPRHPGSRSCLSVSNQLGHTVVTCFQQCLMLQEVESPMMHLTCKWEGCFLPDPCNISPEA